MVKYCQKCGAKLEDDAAFCDECGEPTNVVAKLNISNKLSNDNSKKLKIGIGVIVAIAIILIVAFAAGVFAPHYEINVHDVKISGQGELTHTNGWNKTSGEGDASFSWVLPDDLYADYVREEYDMEEYRVNMSNGTSYDLNVKSSILNSLSSSEKQKYSSSSYLDGFIEKDRNNDLHYVKVDSSKTYVVDVSIDSAFDINGNRLEDLINSEEFLKSICS